MSRDRTAKQDEEMYHKAVGGIRVSCWLLVYLSVLQQKGYLRSNALLNIQLHKLHLIVLIAAIGRSTALQTGSHFRLGDNRHHNAKSCRHGLRC